MTPRRLAPPEMDAAADIHRIAFAERLPMLAGLHTPAETRAFFRDALFPRCEFWGIGTPLQGFIALAPGWVEQFYVLPPAQGRGIGDALLRHAQSRQRELRLWTFQRNAPARRFYERRGFVAIDETDGSGNEERDPDVLYRWTA